MAEQSPTAHRAIAVSELEAAAALARACYVLSQRLSTTPPGMTESNIKQRNILLTLSIRQLEAERDATMDRLVAHWQSFRRIE